MQTAPHDHSPLSPLDEYPVHQIAEVVRHVGTSDRNFYDRYYFNCFDLSGTTMVVMGMGQYPNLGTQDAFILVVRDGMHRVVRASREMPPDRMDTTVGPFRIEVPEPLRRLRFLLEPNEHGIAADLTWEAASPPVLEPRHLRREVGRVTFDTQRFAQTGGWRGTLTVGGEVLSVVPEQWWGTRDRSWGVRPVGEPEPAGIRATRPSNFFWLYCPVRFADFSVVYIVQEEPDGRRVIEDATRVWHDPARGTEWLGRPDHELRFRPGTRTVVGATLCFDGGPAMEVTPLVPAAIAVGTGYGLDADWRHGMYQGPLVVQGRAWSLDDPFVQAGMFAVVDNAARFQLDGSEGYGLFEVAVVGPHGRYGFTGWDDMAPGDR
ncbi:MAG: hypothetical protein C4344_00080 [Acidimicrobiia bacterium]